VTRKRWFLPETPDVLGMLRRQMAEAMASAPDEGIGTMAGLPGGALRCATSTVPCQGSGPMATKPTASADASIAAQRELETPPTMPGWWGCSASRTVQSGSRGGSCTAAPRGSARPWSTSRSVSSVPSSRRAERQHRDLDSVLGRQFRGARLAEPGDPAGPLVHRRIRTTVRSPGQLRPVRPVDVSVLSGVTTSMASWATRRMSGGILC
jgi:hypothetical protein